MSCEMLVIGPATLILGDSTQLWPTLPKIDAIVTDPPYGIDYRVRERKFADRGAGLKATRPTVSESREAIVGDDRPFDPSPWLALAPCAFFGANHFAPRLPVGRWLVWDKRRESKPDYHSDAELVWLSGNPREALRVHRQLWRGIVREGEENCSRSRKLHPNQKPVALMSLILDKMGVQPGDTVLDPFMGSASTGIAALRRGCRFIGFEIDPAHFAVAAERIAGETLDL